MLVLMIITAGSHRMRIRLILLGIVSIALLAMALTAALSFDAIANMFKERAQVVQYYDVGSGGRFTLQSSGARRDPQISVRNGAVRFQHHFRHPAAQRVSAGVSRLRLARRTGLYLACPADAGRRIVRVPAANTVAGLPDRDLCNVCWRRRRRHRDRHRPLATLFPVARRDLGAGRSHAKFRSSVERSHDAGFASPRLAEDLHIPGGCSFFASSRRCLRRVPLAIQRAACRSGLPAGSARQADLAKAQDLAIARSTCRACSPRLRSQFGLRAERFAGRHHDPAADCRAAAAASSSISTGPICHTRCARSAAGRSPDAASLAIGLGSFRGFQMHGCLLFEFVHEIWVPSRFTQSAIASATDLPVHVLPHPLPESSAPRASVRISTFRPMH